MTQPSGIGQKIHGFVTALHFGPTVLVVSISFFLAKTQYSIVASSQVALAILAGQCVVGWSNDLIDYQFDLQASRVKKPLVSGLITQQMLRPAIFISLALALLLSYIGPLGVEGTLIHALGLLSATAYNLKLKRYVFSFLPYIFSFAALPWAIYVSADKEPPLWLYMSFALFATSFHFLNVLKDLEQDIAQGILGLPQRVGKWGSICMAALLLILGICLVLKR